MGGGGYADLGPPVRCHPRQEWELFKDRPRLHTSRRKERWDELVTSFHLLDGELNHVL